MMKLTPTTAGLSRAQLQRIPRRRALLAAGALAVTLLVAACSYLTPLLSCFVSCAYLKVWPGPRLWIACLLVVFGSILTWLSVSEKPRNAAI